MEQIPPILVQFTPNRLSIVALHHRSLRGLIGSMGDFDDDQYQYAGAREKCIHDFAARSYRTDPATGFAFCANDGCSGGAWRGDVVFSVAWRGSGAGLQRRKQPEIGAGRRRRRIVVPQRLGRTPPPLLDRRHRRTQIQRSDRGWQSAPADHLHRPFLGCDRRRGKMPLCDNRIDRADDDRRWRRGSRAARAALARRVATDRAGASRATANGCGCAAKGFPDPAIPAQRRLSHRPARRRHDGAQQSSLRHGWDHQRQA